MWSQLQGFRQKNAEFILNNVENVYHIEIVSLFNWKRHIIISWLCDEGIQILRKIIYYREL